MQNVLLLRASMFLHKSDLCYDIISMCCNFTLFFYLANLSAFTVRFLQSANGLFIGRKRDLLFSCAMMFDMNIMVL